MRLAIFGLTAVGRLGAQDAPTGTYHSRTVTLELTPTGEARFSNRFGPLIVGTFTLARDTILLHDANDAAACPTGTGRYLWGLVADTLRFRVLSDPCDTRRTTLAMPWTRGAPPASTVAELSSVVITAQRQTEDVQRAPVSINVLSPEVLRDAGVTQPQNLTYVAPGLQVGSIAGGSALLYMRGVGNFAGNSLQDPTVTFNFDGVYIARPTATGGLFYDLERVEVLKGPQGTLYGRNATGGAVNILPHRPVLGMFNGEMAAEYGENNTLRAEGAVNIPVGERAALRAAGQHARHSAYMTDGTDDQNDWAGRLSFRYDINDALALRMVADYFDQGGRGAGSTPLALGVDHRFGISSPDGGAYYATKLVTITGGNWTPPPSIQYQNDHHWGANASVDWRTSVGELTLVSASRGSVIDATGSPAGNLVTIHERSRQNSIEARLASTPHRRLQTVAGVFIFDEDIKTPDGEYFRPFNQFGYSLQQPRSGVTSNSAFGRVTWHMSDRSRATLGARHIRESKYFGGPYQSFLRVCTGPACPNAPAFPVDIWTAPPGIVFPADTSVTMVSVANPVDGTTTSGFRILRGESAKFSRTTWRSAFEYDVGDRAFLFTSFETGFKSGGFFYSSDSQVYQPEYVGAFTLGVKSRLFNDRVQANLELFDWQYRDQQVSKISFDTRGIPNLRTENVGRASIRGIEASLEYLPFANTHLSADAEFLDAVYDSYRYRTPARQSPVSGCIKTLAPPDTLIDCSGRRSPFAPERTLVLEAAQVLPLRHGASLTARARPRYQSATLTGLDFLKEEEQPSYWMLDGSLTLATARHSIGVFGQNLTNETIISNTFVVPFSSFPVAALRPPRTIGVRVTTRF